MGAKVEKKWKNTDFSTLFPHVFNPLSTRSSTKSNREKTRRCKVETEFSTLSTSPTTATTATTATKKN